MPHISIFFTCFAVSYVNTSRDKIAAIGECLMLFPLVHCSTQEIEQMKARAKVLSSIESRRKLEKTLSVLPHDETVGASMSSDSETSLSISLFMYTDMKYIALDQCKPKCFQTIFLT